MSLLTCMQYGRHIEQPRRSREYAGAGSSKKRPLGFRFVVIGHTVVSNFFFFNFILFQLWVVRKSDLTSYAVYYLQFANCQLGNHYMSFNFLSVLATTTLKYFGSTARANGKFCILICSYVVCFVSQP